jgi:Glycosyltransferases involved in cell wall biogenesis
MKVNIVMPTYNGARFLVQQIESIQDQTYTDWNLLIRDDGSTDETIDIIKRFVEQDSRIKYINPNDQRNLGVIDSFYTLVKYSQADFYFFSDQDDIWLPKKLEICLKEAKKHDNSRPIMYYTDLKVVDEQLNIISESMIKSQSHHANTTLLAELTENTVTGGVSMANDALIELWQDTDDVIMHDWYLALLAASMGELVFINQPTELYRQHDNNVLGARTWQKRLKQWAKPSQPFAKYWSLIRASQKQARKLLSYKLNEENRQLVENFVDITNQNFVSKVLTVKKYNFRKNRAFHTFIFRSLIITNFAHKLGDK